MAAPPLRIYDTLCYMLPPMPDRTMKISLIVLALCAATPAFAQEPVGCDKFKWPLDKERATLTGADLPRVDSGSRVNWAIPFATTFTLMPLAEAKLPVAPDRTPKSNDAFAGFLQAPAPAKRGIYKITLSSAGWIDVVQDGHKLKSTAATGATGCDGVRKSVKFDLAAAPFTIELSDIEASTIAIAISGE
jgi:hypothetical protein